MTFSNQTSEKLRGLNNVTRATMDILMDKIEGLGELSFLKEALWAFPRLLLIFGKKQQRYGSLKLNSSIKAPQSSRRG